MILDTRPIRFTQADAERANALWRFNCGPGALCAILYLTPDELRPHLGDFERKGYTNPTLMFDTLKRCGATYRLACRSDAPSPLPIINHGLFRIQWGGPWTKPGVPMRARYRQTHWVAVRNHMVDIFDVNIVRWLTMQDWLRFIPTLIRDCCPKGDGSWWVTHAIEVEPKY